MAEKIVLAYSGGLDTSMASATGRMRSRTCSARTLPFSQV